ncbi:hypothetical protein VTO42DRAFT_8279 [Malbranchea cinnamomea]
MATTSPAIRAVYSRRHLESESAPLQSGRNVQLPPYEPQIAELNPTAKRSVQALVTSSNLRHLKTHLEHVVKALTENAGAINDALVDARARYEKRLRRKREMMRAAASASSTERDNNEGDGSQNGEKGRDEEDEQALRRLEELERRVNETTERLEEKMRGVVDAEVRINTLTDVLQKIGREEVVMNLPRGRRRTGRGLIDVEDGEEEDTDGEYEPQNENGDGAQVVSATQTLDATLAEKKKIWESLSLTQRYTTNNSYTGFYRVVHDAKNPGENNTTRPLPHASTWFSHMEQPREEGEEEEEETGISHRTRNNNKRKRAAAASDEGEEDDDLAIDGERISLKCPITLLPLKDPVTSTKCPHSFEREAIEQMIRNSRHLTNSRHGGARRKYVQCPVCTVELTLDDLRSDPVLLRRVRRANAIAAREDEDDGEDDRDDGAGTEEDLLATQVRRKIGNISVKQERMTRSPTRVLDTQYAEGDEESGVFEEEDEEENE